MSKITEYTIVSGESNSQLTTSVNQHIDKGWIPQGGVNTLFVERTTGGPLLTFLQAMVKPTI